MPLKWAVRPVFKEFRGEGIEHSLCSTWNILGSDEPGMFHVEHFV